MFKFKQTMNPESFCPQRVIECNGKDLKTTWCLTGVWWNGPIDVRKEIYAVTKDGLQKELNRKLNWREIKKLRKEVLEPEPVYG